MIPAHRGQPTSSLRSNGFQSSSREDVLVVPTSSSSAMFTWPSSVWTLAPSSVAKLNRLEATSDAISVEDSPGSSRYTRDVWPWFSSRPPELTKFISAINDCCASDFWKQKKMSFIHCTPDLQHNSSPTLHTDELDNFCGWKGEQGKSEGFDSCDRPSNLFYTTSSFVHHFKSIGEFKLELQSGNAQFR